MPWFSSSSSQNGYIAYSYLYTTLCPDSQAAPVRMVILLTAIYTQHYALILKQLQSEWLVEVLLYIHRNHRFIRDRSPGRPPWLSHSSWALRMVIFLAAIYTLHSALIFKQEAFGFCVWLGVSKGGMGRVNTKAKSKAWLNCKFHIHIPCTFAMSPEFGKVQRSVATAIPTINLGTCFDEELQALHMTLAGCLMHWCDAVIIDTACIVNINANVQSMVQKQKQNGPYIFIFFVPLCMRLKNAEHHKS